MSAKRIIQRVLLGLTLFVVTAHGYERHEVITSGTIGSLGFTAGQTVLAVGGGYNYTITPPVQLGFFPSVTYLSGTGASQTGLSLLVGPTLNFPMGYPLADAVFISGLVGLRHSSSGGFSATKFTFSIEAGKRFSLLPHFCYRPSLSFVKTADSDASFVISFLAFAATF